MTDNTAAAQNANIASVKEVAKLAEMFSEPDPIAFAREYIASRGWTPVEDAE